MSNHVSMIHPNLYNEALRRLGIDFLTVSDGENGLVVSIDEGTEPGTIAGSLANLAALVHVQHDLVIPSNVGRVENVIREIEEIVEYGTVDAESREHIDEMMGDLRTVVDNLTNMTKDVKA